MASATAWSGRSRPNAELNSPEKLPSILADLLATDETPGRGLRPAHNRRREDVARRPVLAGQRSLFGEILDWMMVPLLLLWPMSVAITFVVARSIADAPYDRALQDRLRVLAQQVRFVDDLPQVTLSAASRELVRADGEDKLYFQFVDPVGEVLAGEPDLPSPTLYAAPEIGAARLRQDLLRGEELRVAFVYVGSETGRGRPVLVQLAETQEKRTQLANEIIKGVILPQFLILPLAIGLVWFGLGRGLRPLRLMQRGIRARRPDDLSPIDPKSVPQEISPLVDAFNHLLERLERSVSVQKRFIADAAHQMKTPLAGLRMQAELALRESDPAEVRKSLEQLARSSERAAHLTSQLLALARTENLRKGAAFERIELNGLVRSIVTEWADKALMRGIDVGFETEDVPAPIAGHPILLRELFANLIDNALRYTPRGGVVTVRVRSEDGHACVDVEDSGPGIPEHERPLVFERFYRVLGTQADGSGLGLAIVKEIAEHHDAVVRLADTTPGAPSPGTRVTILFEPQQET